MTVHFDDVSGAGIIGPCCYSSLVAQTNGFSNPVYLPFVCIRMAKYFTGESRQKSGGTIGKVIDGRYKETKKKKRRMKIEWRKINR